METKALPFQLSELKASGDGWEVAGYASTFGGNPDSYGDVVAKGAFLDSLAKRPNVRLLWQHDMGEPIGKVLSLTEDDHGLFGRWSLVPTDAGTKAHKLLHAGLVDSLSIGFMPDQADYRDDGVRVLKAVELVEVSIVTIPANTNAVITAFKADQPLHLLLKQVADGFDTAVRQAKATHERRQSEGRSLNDQINAELAGLIAKAEAGLDELRALRVVPPDAKAEAAEIELLRMRSRLLRARSRRTA